jgi:opacity protein-like surface antigen
MRKLIVAATAALMSTSALAADKGQPAPYVPEIASAAMTPSCYVSGTVGSSINSVEGGALPAAISASGWTVGAGLGCDVRLDRIVIGALGRIEVPVDTNGALVDFEKSWAAAARLGYMVNTGLLAYGLVGYESQDFTLAGIDLGNDGIMVGGGLEVMISKHLSLTAEYTTTLIDDKLIGGVAVKPESHKARLGIVYRMNSLFGE